MHWKVCFEDILKLENHEIGKMSLINRNFKALKFLQRIVYPTTTCRRSIGNVNQSSEVNIFDVFNSKVLQKERAAKR